jgi:hypothetical protein
MPAVNRVPVWFAERTARGMLTRMVGSWLLVGLPVIAARICWSVPAAIAVSVVTLTAYVTVAIRYMRRTANPRDAGVLGGRGPLAETVAQAPWPRRHRRGGLDAGRCPHLDRERFHDHRVFIGTSATATERLSASWTSDERFAAEARAGVSQIRANADRPTDEKQKCFVRRGWWLLSRVCDSFRRRARR